MNLLRAALFAAIPALLWLTPAMATPVEYDYFGPECVYCGSEAAGTALTIRLWIDSAALAPNGAVSSADVLNYTADFGSIHLSDADAGGMQFSGNLDGSGSSFITSSWTFLASDTLSDLTGTILTASYTAWYVYFGYCSNEACGTAFEGDYKGYALDSSGSPDVNLVPAVATTPAPEPFTASLFAAGLLGLGFRRRASVATLKERTI